MASEQNDAILPEEDQDLDDDEFSEDDDLEENDDVLPDEEEEFDDEDLNSASTATTVTVTAPAVTVAFPSSSALVTAATVALPPTTIDVPDSKRQRIVEPVAVNEEKKPLPQQLDESRRLFQRLWTDEDEIELLQGFLDYTTQRGSAHHHDTALFYDQIKSKLQLDFNKNQLVEKLRRLKKKYRNVLNKISSGKDFSFKTAHDHATFEISRKIWSGNNMTNVNVLDDEDANNHINNNHVSIISQEMRTNNNSNFNYGLMGGGNNNEEKVTPKARKRSRSKMGGIDNINNVGFMNNTENVHVSSSAGGGGGGIGIRGVVEETVRSCLSPLFRELLSSTMGGVVGGRGIGGLAMNAVMPLGFGGPGMGMGMMGFGGSGVGVGEVIDEKWRKQQILELEVYSKRLELVQDQIKVALEELRSMGG